MSSPRGVDRNLNGIRALVMGLGTRQGGLGVARFLVRQGADVTVTDLRSADDLESTLRELAGLPIRYVLGEHRAEDFQNVDLVVRNPGVPVESPWLEMARAAGARIEMEMSLFFRHCPAPILGITGTKGKTTTSYLCASIMQQHDARAVLAGNMGRSALDMLPDIDAGTPVVIELSSWQLEGLADHALSPHVGVITNISQDHLNRYPSMVEYIEAKRHIARFQDADDWLILNQDDDVVWETRHLAAGRVIQFGTELPGDGASLEGESLLWRQDGETVEICQQSELPLAGRHNALNALAAAAATIAYGVDLATVRRGLLGASAVADRQEPVATIDDVLYVNDTTATSPAAAVAALETFDNRPIVLIAGGSEKNVSLQGLAEAAAAKAAAVVLLDGAATGALQRLLQQSGTRRISGPHPSMASAVRAARELAPPGAVVLLSPGCASFGMFRDEFHRGRTFREAVAELEANGSGEALS